MSIVGLQAEIGTAAGALGAFLNPAAPAAGVLPEVSAELVGTFLMLVLLTERGLADGADPDGRFTVARARALAAKARRLLAVVPFGGPERAQAVADQFDRLDAWLAHVAVPVEMLARPDGLEFGEAATAA